MSEGALRCVPASDASVLVVVERPTIERVLGFFHAVRAAPPPWLVNLHPAYASVLIDFDLALAGHDDVVAYVRTLASSLPAVPTAAHAQRVVEVPVIYGGEDGPDLLDVARHAQMSADDVVAAHAGAVYQVAFMGFLPGFAYLAGLPAALTVPRLAVPRAQVPAGAVAIGGAQTAIYPVESPGGWRVIGRTALPLPPEWVTPGDRVRFRAVR